MPFALKFELVPGANPLGVMAPIGSFTNALGASGALVRRIQCGARPRWEPETRFGGRSAPCPPVAGSIGRGGQTQKSSHTGSHLRRVHPSARLEADRRKEGGKTLPSTKHQPSHKGKRALALGKTAKREDAESLYCHQKRASFKADLARCFPVKRATFTNLQPRFCTNVCVRVLAP